jgi:hypothetical protein
LIRVVAMFAAVVCTAGAARHSRPELDAEPRPEPASAYQVPELAQVVKSARYG